MKLFKILPIYIVLLTQVLIVVTSCKKDTENRNTGDLADKYIGQYSVTETAKILGISSFVEYHNFVGTIIKGDSSDRIRTIQSNRNPKPAWVGWSSDTIDYKIYPLTDSLKHPSIGLARGKIYSNDTIRFNYWYGAGSFIYDIYQTWVKIR